MGAVELVQWHYKKCRNADSAVPRSLYDSLLIN